MFGVFNLIS